MKEYGAERLEKKALSEKDIIGKTEEEASFVLSNANAEYRITRREGETFIVTRNYVASRYNLEIDNGYVSRVRMG